MAGNFWTESEIIEKGRTSETKMPQYSAKFYFLNRGDHCTVNSVEIGDPKGFPSHIHRYHDEVIEILEGEGDVVVGDETRKLKKGDVFFIPKGVPHELKMKCRLLSVYSPAFDTENPDRVFVE
jgi:quercetin dioxygenase-like cupin family protein